MAVFYVLVGWVVGGLGWALIERLYEVESGVKSVYWLGFKWGVGASFLVVLLLERCGT